MSDDLTFDRSRDAEPGVAVEVIPGVRRVLAPNPSPFTFTGTNSYVVGRGRVAIVDPGPRSEAHLAALLAAVTGETVEAIVVTHSHLDHVGGLAALKAATGAPVYGAGPHRPFRALEEGEGALLDASSDAAYRPDVELADGQAVEGDGWALVAVATPGHTANHLAFALPGAGALLSGDHVMAWSTSIVAPPDGAMAPYMASLRGLMAREEEIYLPGHGPRLDQARTFVRHLIGHRLMRETAILARLKEGERRAAQLVAELYRGLDPGLSGAAALSVFAHLEDLVARGLAETDGAPRLNGVYRLA
ncbi:MBL fold metallo-hydrolase [Methylopila jiangsuensis]|uniref:MBL fold metallo-hydrolase n=1 Tax=Methylopila jiangsuensis TaxID=586230 RepID=A0A9W6JFB0_9HYPH|nr:MBL fold metallo-hydrolase [Methylopila jiangsuensis]MDR6285470.1 glyoxylase-like metal-dependent hydrolase (beta-lactamase superfamily II) [Methylopila jiangsuensis]GLK75228.1 MBL fold metallo-hydrolase [Methylopila jiangsuensis]